MKKATKKEEGSVIYFAILILGILISAGLAATTIVVRQVGMVREMNYSVGAFYSADAGIEMTLYRWREDIEGGGVIEWGTHVLEDAEYTQEYEVSSSTNGGLEVNSIGRYSPTAAEEYSIRRGIRISRPTLY